MDDQRCGRFVYPTPLGDYVLYEPYSPADGVNELSVASAAHRQFRDGMQRYPSVTDAEIDRAIQRFTSSTITLDEFVTELRRR